MNTQYLVFINFQRHLNQTVLEINNNKKLI